MAAAEVTRYEVCFFTVILALSGKDAGRRTNPFATDLKKKTEGFEMDLTEMMKAGEQILQRALEAVCRYQQAIDLSAPAVEVEHLRIEAESLMRAVREYQMRAKGFSRS